jgi:cysteine desulfurase
MTTGRYAVPLSVEMTVYLDHAATTPILPEAAAVMTEQLMRVGNASSLHGSGRDARRVVEESRETIARALGCRPGEVVFTSGGTESDNLAVKGLFWSRRTEDPRRVRILSTPIEHHAVLDALHWLAVDEGAKVEHVEVDRIGRLDVAAFRAAVESDPESIALVSVMWANNEVGTVQPIDEVVEIAHAHGIPVHTDAVQALGQLPLDFAASGVDAMTVTGHKVGGPYGVGALVVRRDLQPTALMHGGGQERDIRSGTIDPPAIAGFAVACRLAVERQPELAARLTGLRDLLVEGVRRQVPDAVYNGDPEDGPTHRMPGIAHLLFPGCEGDSLLMLLDARGIECSTGSACDAGVPQASHVLLAMGSSEESARSSLRFSLGHTSTQQDVDALVEAIGPVVERARSAGLSGRSSRSER